MTRRTIGGLLLGGCVALASGCGGPAKAVKPTPTTTATPVAAGPSGAELQRRGGEALAASRIEEAAELLAQGLEIGDETPVARYQLALALARLGKLDDAAESAERAFALADEEPYVAALDLATRAWIAAGDPQRAVGLARDAAEGDRENLSYQNILHRALIASGDLSTVLREARDVLKKDETNLGAMRNLAACYLQMGKLENATYILKQALEIRGDAELYLLMARVRVLDKDVTGAIFYLQKAVEANPTFIEALSDLGALYAKVGDASSAVAELERAVTYAPGNRSLWLHLGNGLRGLQRYREAEQAYKKALELDPTMAEVHYNLGVLYLENPVDGMDPELRLETAIDEFNTYRDTRKASAERDEEIEGFIAEAKELIKIEKQRREDAQKQPEPEEPEGDGGDEGDGEGDGLQEDSSDPDGGVDAGEGLDTMQPDGAPVGVPDGPAPSDDAAPVVSPAPEPAAAPLPEPTAAPDPTPAPEPAVTPLPEPAPVPPAVAPLPEPTPLPEPEGGPTPLPEPEATPVLLPDPQ